MKGILVALVMTLSFSANAEDAGEVIRSVEAKYKDVNALRAKFTQVTRSEALGDQKQLGKLEIERPSKMRWDFSGDGRQFITDGSTMWIYNPADKQVLRYSDFTASAATADALLQSLDRIGELFHVELLGQEPGPTLKLRPKKDEGQVKELRLTLDASLVLSGVVIMDAFGGTTEMSFTDVELVGDVPDERFRFVVPEGVEVLDAGGF